MLRLLAFLVAVILIAFFVAPFVDSPGIVTFNWLGYEGEMSAVVAVATILLILVILLLAWSAIRFVFTRPAAMSRYLRHRKEERGLDALSQGLIAVSAGDREQAQKYTSLAWRRLPDEPLTGLLRAQTAQLTGERREARRIFEAMAAQPRTELLGLRGLYLEARRENELEAARQFAERAVERDPDLPWSVTALFELQCSAGDWEGALKTLEIARRHKQIDRETADRRRAVLLAARAMDVEQSDTGRFRALATEANKLAPGLVPAADMAARALVSQNNVSKAGRVLTKAWELSPHPDIASAYAHLRPGDSTHDRLKRVKSLVSHAPDGPEAPIAVASAAFEAREWAEARNALMPLLDDDPSARVCTLMARIEGGEHGDQGRVREWLARALRAPRDPVWTADGYVSADWLPVSPVTGELDAFEWKVPVDAGTRDSLGIGAEELARLTRGPEAASSTGEGLRRDPAAPPRLDGPAPAPASRPEPDALVVDATPVTEAPPAKVPAPGRAPAPAAGARPLPAAAAQPASELQSAPKQASPAPSGVAAASLAERDPLLRSLPGEDAEPEIFVAPRPPDDPGPDADPDDLDPPGDPWPPRKM